jgi:hypothetical protein
MKVSVFKYIWGLAAEVISIIKYYSHNESGERLLYIGRPCANNDLLVQWSLTNRERIIV